MKRSNLSVAVVATVLVALVLKEAWAGTAVNGTSILNLLVIALPLLTVFADVLGVLGGMVMARQQLDVGYVDFLDRFVKAVVTSTALTGIGKAPVFAAIISSSSGEKRQMVAERRMPPLRTERAANMQMS